jgi:hypothetical protein
VISPRVLLVRTDARARLSLSKLLEPDRDYRATLHPDGTVVLEPVTAYTRAQWEAEFPTIPFPEGATYVVSEEGTL